MSSRASPGLRAQARPDEPGQAVRLLQQVLLALAIQLLGPDRVARPGVLEEGRDDDPAPGHHQAAADEVIGLHLPGQAAKLLPRESPAPGQVELLEGAVDRVVAQGPDVLRLAQVGGQEQGQARFPLVELGIVRDVLEIQHGQSRGRRKGRGPGPDAPRLPGDEDRREEDEQSGGRKGGAAQAGRPLSRPGAGDAVGRAGREAPRLFEGGAVALDELDAVLDAQLPVDVVDVVLDRMVRNEEGLGDLLVPLALDEQANDLAFAAGDAVLFPAGVKGVPALDAEHVRAFRPRPQGSERPHLAICRGSRRASRRTSARCPC